MSIQIGKLSHLTSMLRKSVLLLFVVVFVGTICFSLTASQNTVSGQSSTPHPYEAAKIYQAYWALRTCFSKSDLDEGNRSIDDMRDGDIFSSYDDVEYRPTYLRASKNEPGNCHNGANTGPMFQDLGIDPLTFLTTDTGSGRIYNPNNSQYEANDSLNRGQRVSYLESVVSAQYPGLNIGNTASPSQEYFAIQAHFLQRCVEGENVPPAAGGTDVRMVNTDGTEETISVLVRDRNGDGVAYGVNGISAGSQSTGSVVSCRDMATILNNNATQTLADIQAWVTANPDGVIPSGSQSVNEEEDNSCESAGGALGWIMCPIAGLLDSVVGFLDEQIRQLLFVNQRYFDEGNGSGGSLKDAWRQLRNIAYAVLIPIMLVMVIGTALGFDVFSAYTIKKALPRMIIAVIFITLSWYICVFLVNFFNTIGAGIGNIITTPFGYDAGARSPLKSALDNAGITQSGNGWAQSVASGTTVTALGVAGAVGAFASGLVSIGIIMSTLATAALILGLIFLLLIARQMIVIALALVAPLAILSWIFPGNDKMWKLWWGSFSKLLMVYPLITLLIGVGQAFAFITGTARNQAGDNQLVTIIIVVGAFIMPFLFVPFAFKWAGGVFANLAGMVNDRERGVLDRLKKGRGNMRARHMADAKQFGRFKGDGALAGRMNDLGGMLTNTPNNYATPGRMRATRAAGQATKATEDLKNDRTNQANQNNDKFLLALGDRTMAEQFRNASRAEAADTTKTTAERNSAAQAAMAWDNALSSADVVKTKNNPGTKLAAIQAHSATGYNLSAGQEGYNQLATSVTRAMGIGENEITRDSAGNITGVTGSKAGLFAEAMNSAQYGLKGAGRYDLGGINDGQGYSAEAGLGKASLYELANGKKQSITTLAQQQVTGMGEALSGQTTQPDGTIRALNPSEINDRFMNAAILEKELDAMLPNSKGGTRDEILKQKQALLSAGGKQFQDWKQRRSGEVARDKWGNPMKDSKGNTIEYSMSEVAGRRARNFERPDLNRL